MTADWSADPYLPSTTANGRAEHALSELRQRSALVRDEWTGRLVDFCASDRSIHLALQPSRWALSLADAFDIRSLAVLCLVRDHDGRWLAGRRAQHLATLPGIWALGAAGAIEVGEHPIAALRRELTEEWGLSANVITVNALVQRSLARVFLVANTRLPTGTNLTPNHEHDASAWWPADPAAWPPHATELMRKFASIPT